MKRDTITINGEAYQIGFSFRAVDLYEKLTGGESISQCTSTWDNLLYFYATLDALNEHFKMTLDEFVDYLDEHPAMLADFQTSNGPEPDTDIDIDDKKKLTTKQIFALWMLMLLLVVSPISIPIISLIGWIYASLRLLARLIANLGKKPASRP